MRSIILVNTNLLTNAWKQIDFQHLDITAIEIKGPFGTLRIINAYNNCKNNTALTHISNFTRDHNNHLQMTGSTHTIWLGDFNHHHPLWDEERNAHLFTRSNLELTQPLLNMLGCHNMKMALPPFTPTLKAHNTGNYTRVDNIFCSESIMDAIIKCNTDDTTRPIKMDHFPIITQIDIHMPKVKWTPRRNFRLTDWPEFLKTLDMNLTNIHRPTEIHNIATFIQRLNSLNKAIQDTVEKHVKLTTPSPYLKRWWSSDLSCKKKLATDTGKARIPTIQIKDTRTNRVICEAKDNKSKGQLFHETFFPPPNPNTPPVPQNFQYPTPRWTFTNITNKQIMTTIGKLKPYKASKNNTVPNSIFTHTREVLVPYLGPLYHATYSLNYYPQEWATTETLILKKPGKPNYTSPSAWRPIVLSDSIARLLNSCQTNTIVTMCENLNILPEDHYGTRPGRTTTDSIHMLTKTVKDAWRKRQVTSCLFLDVKGAFPSVDINRLIHNMRKRGIPQEYTNWMRRHLANCKTTLAFDDHITTAFTVENRLDQGDPFSSICYLIYNSNLTIIPNRKAGEQTLLFVDDAAIIVTGRDFTETHNKLQNIMNRPKGIFAWAKRHNCMLRVNKFQLLDLTKKLIPHQFNPRRIPIPRRALILGEQHIPSKETAKFLGVTVDNKLSWKAHCATALAKGQDWLIQFRRLAQMTQGVNAKYIQQLYLAIAIPRMLYAADIFLTPQQNVGNLKRNNQNGRTIINKLTSIQCQAAIMITGAMKSTATDVLEVMANLIPFHILVDKTHQRAALHLATLPPFHPLHKMVLNVASRLVKWHPTLLHDLMHR